jgi:hypothetical protein
MFSTIKHIQKIAVRIVVLVLGLELNDLAGSVTQYVAYSKSGPLVRKEHLHTLFKDQKIADLVKALPQDVTISAHCDTEDRIDRIAVLLKLPEYQKSRDAFVSRDSEVQRLTENCTQHDIERPKEFSFSDKIKLHVIGISSIGLSWCMLGRTWLLTKKVFPKNIKDIDVKNIHDLLMSHKIVLGGVALLAMLSYYCVQKTVEKGMMLKKKTMYEQWLRDKKKNKRLLRNATKHAVKEYDSLLSCYTRATNYTALHIGMYAINSELSTDLYASSRDLDWDSARDYIKVY